LNQHLHTGPGGIHEDLLVKHLLGETAPEEAAGVEAWLAADAANRHYYEHFQLIWRESRRLGDNFQETDEQEEAAWQKFRQKIHRPSPLQVVKAHPVTTRILPGWTRIAAILLVVASVSGLLYLFNHHTAVPERLLTSNTTPINDTLPDGSQITLNRQSSIAYPATFSRDRSIRLKGEAFFKIAPDEKRPFHVYANGVTITVLGTSFNVRESGGSTEIIVETGLVRVSDSLHSFLLHPSEKVVLHQGDSALLKDSTHSALYQYYRTKEFVCDNTPLWQLAQSLEEAYDVKITIADPSLRALRINTTFRNTSLDQILSIIQETFRIKATRSGNLVTLQL
jgi:transmembrane sensor